MKYRGPLVFGMTDGAVLVLGLYLGLVISMQSSNALWHAALGGGLAELGGMSLGQYWAQPGIGKLAAGLNGAGCAATTIVCGLPFAPFLLLSRSAAIGVSAVIMFLSAVIICFLREERGWAAISHTFGLLIIAGAMSGASGLI